MPSWASRVGAQLEYPKKPMVWVTHSTHSTSVGTRYFLCSNNFSDALTCAFRLELGRRGGLGQGALLRGDPGFDLGQHGVGLVELALALIPAGGFGQVPGEQQEQHAEAAPQVDQPPGPVGERDDAGWRSGW